ncbi:hypothetical protein [Candidatus Leptofilum sp.]|uniref:hypothetical protein n=1 Tax=Candidatus Leptofilum sp. TaxID=3241576 RepID=UPI003B5BC0D3
MNGEIAAVLYQSWLRLLQINLPTPKPKKSFLDEWLPLEKQMGGETLLNPAQSPNFLSW